MPTNVLIICIAGVAIILAVTGVASRARRTRIARFDSRELISVDQLCLAHFSNLPARTVTECLAMISRVTGINAGRLRPTDRFDMELKLPRGSFIAGEWDDIEDAIEKQYRQVKPHAKVLTIGDFVELMAVPCSIPTPPVPPLGVNDCKR